MPGLKVLAICVAFLACSASIGAQYVVDEENDYSENLLKRQAAEACFEPVEDIEQLDKNIVNIFRKDSVDKCFKTLHIGNGITKVFQTNDTNAIGDFLDAEASKFCPTWPASKKCIYDYLKNNCNGKEILKIKESATFYHENLAYPLLVCEPKWEYLSRFFLQSWKNIGLYDCLAGGGNSLKFIKCSINNRRIHVQSGHLPNFKETIKEYASCMYPIISECSNGDKGTELEMTTVLNLISDAFQNSFDEFWSDYLKQ